MYDLVIDVATGGVRTADGVVLETLSSANPADLRDQLMDLASGHARVANRPLLIHVTDAFGEVALLANPDGVMTLATSGDLEAAALRASQPVEEPTAACGTEDSPSELDSLTAMLDESSALEPSAEADLLRPEPAAPVAPTTSPGTLVLDHRPTEGAVIPRNHQPAGSPETVQPSGFRAAAQKLQTGWQSSGATTGRAVVMFANTKGGSGKTPTSIGTMSAIGIARRGDVALVDFDPTGNLSGRLGLPPGRTVPNLLRLLDSVPTPTPTQLHEAMGWNAPGQFWAVGARESAVEKDGGVAPKITAGQVDAILHAIGTTCSVIGLDAGNDDADEGFIAAAEQATHLVVPTAWDQQSVTKAFEMLANVEDLGLGRLASQAIIVGTYSPRDRPNRRQEQKARHDFGSYGLRIVDVPPDRHIAARDVMSWQQLAAGTRRGFETLAAQITSGR